MLVLPQIRFLSVADLMKTLHNCTKPKACLNICFSVFLSDLFEGELVMLSLDVYKTPHPGRWNMLASISTAYLLDLLLSLL